MDTQAKTTYNNSYTYGSTRPHAPTKIGLQNLSYDGNGNQTASTGTFEVGREVTWNDLDQLTKEVDSSYTNTYVYNSEDMTSAQRRASASDAVGCNANLTLRPTPRENLQWLKSWVSRWSLRAGTR